MANQILKLIRMMDINYRTWLSYGFHPVWEDKRFLNLTEYALYVVTICYNVKLDIVLFQQN